MTTTKEQREALCKKNWLIAFELEQERLFMEKNSDWYHPKELSFMADLVETFKQRATFNQITIEKGEISYAIAE